MCRSERTEFQQQPLTPYAQFRFIEWYKRDVSLTKEQQPLTPYTQFRFIEWYKRDVSLTKEQNFDSSRSPRTHNFVLSSGISAMCRSQKNRIYSWLRLLVNM